MKLEYFLKEAYKPVRQVTEQEVYDIAPGSAKKVLLVETQEEYDIQEAMQYMYGSELLIVLARHPTHDYHSALADFSWVFTTWNPRDPNRI